MDIIGSILESLFLTSQAGWRKLQDLGIVTDNNPTKEWEKEPSREIVVNLDDHTFCGVEHGEPIEKLRFLGRCDDYGFITREHPDGSHDARAGSDEWYRLELTYAFRGFVIYCDPEMRFIGLMLWTSDPDDGMIGAAYAGSISIAGRSYGNDDLPDADGMRRCLGEPDDIDEVPMSCYEGIELNPNLSLILKDFSYDKAHTRCVLVIDNKNRIMELMLGPRPDPQS